MSNKKKKITEAFKALGIQPEQSFAAKVVSVKEETIVVDDDGYTYYGVRLKATVNGSGNNILLKPKVGSFVIVSRINKGEDWYVSMVSEVDNVIISISSKFTLKNAQISFKELLNDIITEFKNAIITTPAGAGNVSPTTQAKLEKINKKINQLFN